MAEQIQRNFAGGELAPALYARADQSKYQTGVRLAKNWYIQKAGGLANRPGTEFVWQTPGGYLKFLKFVRNDKSYVLLISFVDDIIVPPALLYFISDGRTLKISEASPTTWITATPYQSGDVVLRSGNYYICSFDVTSDPLVDFTNWHNLGPNASAEYRHAIQGHEAQNFQAFGRAAGISPSRFSQSGDIILLTRFQTNPLEIRRRTQTKFGLRDFTATTLVGPPLITFASFTSGTDSVDYVATNVSPDLEESVPSAVYTVSSTKAPSAADPITITLNNNLQVIEEQNVYRSVNGKFYYVGTVTPPNVTFRDVGALPDYSATPPRVPSAGFLSGFEAPTAVGFIQQRTVFAASANDPERVWTSRIGYYRNFNTSLPSQDDDAVSFQLAARDVSSPVAILELGVPVMLTTSGEWIISGDESGALLPTAINMKRLAYNGCSPWVQPTVIDDTCIYVQARGSFVRDFRYKIESDGYEGRDLSVFASHLFKDKQILAIDYAQNPDSLVYAVRDDGVMLVLSYLREHSIWGWTTYETDGKYLDVAVIPEGPFDVPYVIVERTINGVKRYYVERFVPRSSELADAYFVDSGLTYDGTRPGTLTITSQPSMTVDDDLLCTASSPNFTASTVGDVLECYALDSGGNRIGTLRMTVIEYLSTTTVRATPSKDLSGPDIDLTLSTLVGVAIPSGQWKYAADTISGLSHLDGKVVSVVDENGVVITNGYEAPLIGVSAGAITLPRPLARCTIGLPYRCDMESLDLEARDGTTVRARNKNISHVGVIVESTSQLKAGVSFDKLTSYKTREWEDMGQPTDPKTGFFDVPVQSGWDEETRICIRQDEPLPAIINGLIPRFMVGE